MATGQDTAAEAVRARQARLEHENRTRNLLARVRSIINRMAEADPAAADFAAHLEGRLSALWRAEGTVARSGLDLELLLLDELQTVGGSTGAATLSGPEVRLDARVAGVMILAVHELMTNSLKYGALGCAEGRLAVSWTVSGKGKESRLALKWVETGVPVVSRAPRVEGFGHDLITQRIAYELGGSGEMVLRPGGMTCSIEVPLQS